VPSHQREAFRTTTCWQGRANVRATKDDSPVGQALFDALCLLDTPTLFKSATQPGFMKLALQPITPGLRIAGPALTMACPAGNNLMLHTALAVELPGEVLAVQCHDATYGVWARSS